MKPALQMAKTAANLATANRRIVELEARSAEYEKRAAAEAFLLDMMRDPRAPHALKPSSVDDFFEKRAAIEKQDLEVAKLAAKLASSHGFEIGDPEEPTHIPGPYNESHADAVFTEWLHSLA